MKKRIMLPLLFLLLLFPVLSAAAEGVIINEIMAASAEWKDGRHDDWVELKNTGKSKADLSGWFLSDSKKDPQKWRFPDGTVLKGGETLLVWCVGDDTVTGKGLHASFKLSQEGERVILTAPDGSTQDEIKFPLQYWNVSYGPDGKGGYGYFEKSTPGKANTGAVFSERVPAPVPDQTGGYYDTSVTVTASCAEGAVIRYTLDGETPTLKSPVLPKEGVEIKKTASLRLRAFKDGALPSETADGTYLIAEDRPVPAVCLISDDKYLFNKSTGALVRGNSSSYPNYEKEWEYPVHIEYFDADGERLISQMGSFTAAGHSARQNAQKSIALYARGVFGADTFAFDPFPLRDYGQYHSLLLRSANSDAFSTRLRDPVISSMAEGQGILYQDAVAIQVYINGRYWGHYNLREKINKYFIGAYEGVPEDAVDDIDILARTGSDSWVQNGSNADWLALCDLCKTKDLNDPALLKQVTDALDVDSLFTHAAFEIIIGNTDITNVRVYRVPGGKWRYLLFDVEAGFLGLQEGPLSNYIKDVKAKIQAFRHEPLNALLRVPEMRDRFLKRFAEMLWDCFRWSRVQERFAPWEDVVGGLIPRQYQRWPYLTEKEWRQNVDAVKYYARRRPIKIVDLLAERMKLTKDEKALYFGEVLEKLKQDAGL